MSDLNLLSLEWLQVKIELAQVYHKSLKSMVPLPKNENWLLLWLSIIRCGTD